MSETLLEIEYNYIKETIHQTIEDRYRFLNFYIGLSTIVGSLVAGLFTFSTETVPAVSILVIALISFVMFLVGWVFILMMIRLRQSWHGSMVALNTLKDHHIGEDNEAAFKWRTATLPRPDQMWNINFYSVVLISVISSIYLAATTGLVAYQCWGVDAAIIAAIVATLLNLFAQIKFNQYSLSRDI